MAENRQFEEWQSLRDDEFQEQDVWDVLNDKEDHSKGSELLDADVPSPSKKSRPAPSPSKPISNPSSNSISRPNNQGKIVLPLSAPVKVPDWSKVYQEGKPKVSTSASDAKNYGGETDDDNDDENEMPPHEIVAWRLARSHISAFSVTEGAGRTLKGRDLSKVRNAVLKKTGFIEPPS